jgi:hypothetical protein
MVPSGRTLRARCRSLHRDIPLAENALVRRVARVSLAVVCCSSIFAGACSDSTSPKPSLDPAQLAAHFDSLYVAAQASADPDSIYRSYDLSALEIAPALGARPLDVTVTTGKGVEVWRGFMLVVVFQRAGFPDDSSFTLLAYRDADAHTRLLVNYDRDGHVYGGYVSSNDSPDFGATGSGTAARTALGKTCEAPSPSLAAPDPAYYGSLPCQLATFKASVSLETPDEPYIDPAIRTISFTSTTFKGTRFVLTESAPDIVRRLRARLHQSRIALTLSGTAP